MRILRKHPEFDQHGADETRPSLNRRDKDTTVTADTQFLKSGREIFKNPPGLEDHDWPELVGQRVLEKALRQAAKTARLKITGNVRIYIMPIQKGWVEIGYQFLHP